MFCFGEKMQTVRQKFSDCGRRFHQFWQYDPNAADQFEFLDLLLTIGGFHCKFENKLALIFWCVWNGLAVFHYVMLFTKTVEVLCTSTDFYQTVWYLTVIIVFTLCGILTAMLKKDSDQFQTIRQFINSRAIDSGDPNFDFAAYAKFYRTMKLMIAVMMMTVIPNQIIMAIPSVYRERIFGLPVFVNSCSPAVAWIIRFAFYWTIVPIWLPKYWISSTLIFSQLLGIKANLQIVRRNFARILSDVQDKVDDELKEDRISEAVRKLAGDSDSDSVKKDQQAQKTTRSATLLWKHLMKHLPEAVRAQKAQLVQKLSRDERYAALFWKHLHVRIDETIAKHVETLRFLHLLRDVVKIYFVVNYYFTQTLVASMIFIIRNEQVSFFSVVISTGIVGYLFHIYAWCYWVDSLLYENDAILASVYDLAYSLEYDKSHHSDYKRAQKTLSIIGHGTRKSVDFNCYQLLHISSELFIDLLFTCYSVMTFLNDLKKRAVRISIKKAKMLSIRKIRI